MVNKDIPVLGEAKRRQLRRRSRERDVTHAGKGVRPGSWDPAGGTPSLTWGIQSVLREAAI